MKKNVPLNIIRFASIENEQLLVSLANNKDELALISHVQGLYEAALDHDEVGVNEIVIFQLLVFIHYHFLFSNTSLMRCHLSEAFASTRAAIDAGLIAATIIEDRSKQEQYAKREYPFDGQLGRYFNDLTKKKKPLPHRLIPVLREIHKELSSFASHADIGSFVHRASISKLDPSQDFVSIEYFQFAQNKTERKIHAFHLLCIYILLLDLFADFYVKEQKILPDAWYTKIQQLGSHVQQRVEELKAQLALEQSDQQPTPEPEPSTGNTDSNM